MKKLLTYLLTIILALSLSCFFVACDNDNNTEDENVTTGAFKYEIVTEQRDGTEQKVDDNGDLVFDDLNKPVYEKVDYKFYKITGFTISSDDATKMADGDFSTVEKYRKITIPKTYEDLEGATEDLPVEEIGMSALANQIVFTDVIVGDNIKKIGEGAFAGCTNLKSISLPFVGSEADAVNENKLFGYIFGDSVSTGAATITGKLHQRVDALGEVISSEEDVTFYVPETLKEVELRNVTEIQECAFYGMTTLSKVTLPATVTKIANHAFNGCTSILKMDIPASVSEIGAYAFSGCASLYAVNYDANSVLTTIGAHAFENCSLLLSSYVDLNKTLTLPSTVATVGEYAFSGCTSIKNVDLSNLSALSVIETGVFKGCTSIVSVNVTNKAYVIKSGAFYGCTTLVKEGLKVEGAPSTTVYENCQVGAFDFTF